MNNKIFKIRLFKTQSMQVINLKKLYPDVYFDDLYIVVEDKVYKTLNTREEDQTIFISLVEKNYNNINNTQVYDNYVNEILLSKLNELTYKQMNRIYEYFYLGLTKSEIARLEGCTESAVRKSINRGLIQLRRKIKKII